MATMENVAAASGTGGAVPLDLGAEAKEGKISPIPFIRNHYLKLSKVEKQNFNRLDAKICIWRFLRNLFEERRCLDIQHKDRKLSCTCIRTAGYSIAQEEKWVILEYLLNFSLKPRQDRLFVCLEWVKYAMWLNENIQGAVFSTAKGKVYLIPGSTRHQICKHALARLLGMGRRAWKTVSDGKSTL